MDASLHTDQQSAVEPTATDTTHHNFNSDQ